MELDARWLFVIVGALLVGSLLYDLISGRARLRGFGSYRHQDEPRSYWRAIGAKAGLLVLLGAIAYVRLAL